MKLLLQFTTYLAQNYHQEFPLTRHNVTLTSLFCLKINTNIKLRHCLYVNLKEMQLWKAGSLLDFRTQQQGKVALKTNL